MSKENFKKHLTIILKKMCEFVGADYDSVEFVDDWYLKNEWTTEKQNEFVKWLSDYLYDSKEARDEIMEISRKSKQRCTNVAYEFAFFYGWKIKD